MPVVKVNLGEPQGVVGSGTWLMEVEAVSAAKTRRTQDDMQRFRLRTVEPEEFKGKAYFENCILTDESVFTFDRMLRGLGVDVPEDKAARANFEIDTDTLIGRQCVIIVEPQIQEDGTPHPTYTRTVAVLTVEQAEAQGLDYGPAVTKSEETVEA